MFIHRLISFFVTYFFHTALAASLLYFNTQIIRGFIPNTLICTLIFLAVLGIYNYSNINNINDHVRRKITLLSIIFLFIFSFFNADIVVENIWAIILSCVFVFVYILPFKILKLRNIHYLKIFILSTAWAIASIFGNDITNQLTVFTCILNFIFIFSISLPFDMRDMEADGMKTIPKSFGVAKTTRFSMILFFCFAIIQFQLTQNAMVFFLIAIVGLPYIYLSKTYYQNKYYLAGLELLIPFNTILLMCFYN